MQTIIFFYYYKIKKYRKRPALPGHNMVLVTWIVSHAPPPPHCFRLLGQQRVVEADQRQPLTQLQRGLHPPLRRRQRPAQQPEAAAGRPGAEPPRPPHEGRRRRRRRRPRPAPRPRPGGRREGAAVEGLTLPAGPREASSRRRRKGRRRRRRRRRRKRRKRKMTRKKRRRRSEFGTGRACTP